MSLGENKVGLWERLQSIEDRLIRIEERLATAFSTEVDKKARNAVRRQYYRERKEAQQKGKVPLPEGRNVLAVRDARLRDKMPAWCEMGLRFGACDRPYAFLSWLVYQWNCECYLKKPITFSGSSFRVWNGHSRFPMGAGDLMHYSRARIKMVPFLRNEGERQDFALRPWWDWGTNVLHPVVSMMQDSPTWESFSSRFKTAMLVLCSYRGNLEVGGGFWDFNEEMQTINSMMRELLSVWKPVLEACLSGLRASQCPPVPQNG